MDANLNAGPLRHERHRLFAFVDKFGKGSSRRLRYHQRPVLDGTLASI